MIRLRLAFRYLFPLPPIERERPPIRMARLAVPPRSGVATVHYHPSDPHLACALDDAPRDTPDGTL